MSARYAIYYVPEAGCALDVLGCGLLGRTACGEDAPRLNLCLPESLRLQESLRIEDITKEPRHYGMHATLKAPFELTCGRTEAELCDAVQAVARHCKPLLLPPLQVGTVADGAGGQGTFLALRPEDCCKEDCCKDAPCEAEPCAAIHDLADRCVQEIDAFRAPLSAHDIARRKHLTPRQQAYLYRFGYPYVLDDYRFHITLTDSLNDQAIREQVAIVLRGACTNVCAPHRLEMRSLALVSQPDRQSPFRLLASFPFSSSV